MFHLLFWGHFGSHACLSLEIPSLMVSFRSCLAEKEFHPNVPKSKRKKKKKKDTLFGTLHLKRLLYWCSSGVSPNPLSVNKHNTPVPWGIKWSVHLLCMPSSCLGMMCLGKWLIDYQHILHLSTGWKAQCPLSIVVLSSWDLIQSLEFIGPETLP